MPNFSLIGIYCHPCGAKTTEIPPATPKGCQFPWGSRSPSNTWSPGPNRVSPPKRHLDRFSRFCRANPRDQHTNRQTDRQTDHATCDICSNMHCVHAMQLHHLAYFSSPFRHVAVLTFAVLVCRRFDHTPTSSGHAHLDRQRHDTACRVTRERSDVAENLGRPGGMTLN